MAGKENLLAYLVGKDDGPEAERYRQARDSFWSYCRQMNPPFSGRTGRTCGSWRKRCRRWRKER